MRLFVAVELSEQARAEVAALQTELRSSGADVKWVEPENLHLTLKFLGETAAEKVPALTDGLRQIAAEAQPFSISMEGLGAFPRNERPRVLWVGIKEGRQPLEELAAGVEGACSRLGFPSEERPFSAHLTIGRVRSSAGLGPLVQRLRETRFGPSDRVEVRRAVLLQSVLSPRGPVYHTLAELPLG